MSRLRRLWKLKNEQIIINIMSGYTVSMPLQQNYLLCDDQDV
jgi:hypothetical protein